MSRTPLFAAVKKALAAASRDQGIVLAAIFSAEQTAIAATLGGGCRRCGVCPILDWSAYAKEKKSKGQKPSRSPSSAAALPG